MMVVSLLFGRKYAQTQVSNVFIDATVSEDHSYNNRVTNYPLENGSSISDHIITEPFTLNISGIVSDTPLNILSIFNRSVDSMNRLIRIVEQKEVITVVTGIKVYTDMVITSLNIPRNIQSGQSLTFNIEMQKLRRDNSTVVNIFPNNPFNKSDNVIPREIVADSQNYPFLQQDPPFSLKDQASSGVDAGIQSLLPIPAIISSRILSTALLLRSLI